MERIEQEIQRTLAASGDGSGLALSEITAAWPAAVGDAVARQAWPQRIGRDGTLHVSAASSTWAFELDRLAPEICERLAAVLGSSAPTKLRFKVGPVPEPAGPVEASSNVSGESFQATPESVSEAASLTAEIDDPELREAVARAARASLSRGSSDRGF
jgi:hypothetical protein